MASNNGWDASARTKSFRDHTSLIFPENPESEDERWRVVFVTEDHVGEAYSSRQYWASRLLAKAMGVSGHKVDDLPADATARIRITKLSTDWESTSATGA
ncbi:hypothetical protein [Aldersonia kunmingensis]|uniref:hypothetical protein n=1 Tax=Aldersonia kunmingensis TaxID=408066 RepID=UPI000B2930F6|nr:hypothetical protein [Aldersonia kunmingensis]